MPELIPEVPSSPQPTLGLFGATMVGVGAMVGAGIFVLCGVAMGQAGPGAMLAFALNGVLALLTAFSFAELASAFPESGGGYVFAKKVFPIGGAFAAGWVLWFAYVVACALYALGFSSFLGYAIRIVSGASLPAFFGPAVAALMVLLSTGILAWRGAGAGNWISFAKLVAFAILIVAGAVALGGRPAGTAYKAMTPFLPLGIGGVFAAMGYTFIALEGFEIIAAIGEEVKNPSRTIPKAMFYSIAATLVVYMGLLFVVLTVGGAPGHASAWKELAQKGDTAVAVAAHRFAGPLGSVVVVAAGLLATFSALAATLLASSRISFSMARDRALPRGLSELAGRARSPRNALFWSSALVILLIVVTGNVEIAGAAASLIFLLSFALTNAAGLLVRIRVGTLASYQAPLYPLLPILGIAACGALAVFQAVLVPTACFVVVGWLLVGGLLYSRLFGRRARTVSARSEAYDDLLVKLRGRTPLVLVPMANPERVEPLLTFAYAMATPGTGRVLAVTVARETKNEEQGAAACRYAQAVVGRAIDTARQMGRPFEGVVLLAPDVTAAIAKTAIERRPEAVLLGMSDMAREGETRVLEEILAATASDVAVLNAPPTWSLDEAKRILVPVASSTHDPLRARVLGMLLRGGARTATLLRVVAPVEDASHAERDLRRQGDDLGIPPDRCLVEQSADPVAVILRHSEEADLIVLGFGSEGRRGLLGKFTLQIVGGAQCAVVAIAQASSSAHRNHGGSR